MSTTSYKWSLSHTNSPQPAKDMFLYQGTFSVMVKLMCLDVVFKYTTLRFTIPRCFKKKKKGKKVSLTDECVRMFFSQFQVEFTSLYHQCQLSQPHLTGLRRLSLQLIAQ